MKIKGEQIEVFTPKDKEPYIKACFGCANLPLLEEVRQLSRVKIDNVFSSICDSCMSNIIEGNVLKNGESIDQILNKK